MKIRASKGSEINSGFKWSNKFKCYLNESVDEDRLSLKRAKRLEAEADILTEIPNEPSEAIDGKLVPLNEDETEG